MGDAANPYQFGQGIPAGRFVQRSLLTSLGTTVNSGGPTSDPLDPTVIAARQRAQQRSTSGLNSDFGTSTRGTDAPQNTGLRPAPDPNTAPIIGSSPSPAPGVMSVDQRDAAAAAAERARDSLDSATSIIDPRTGRRIQRQ